LARGVGQVLTRGHAAAWTYAALHRSVPGQCGGGAGAASGGGGQGGDGSGEGEGLRGRDGGVVVSVISSISHGNGQTTGSCLPQLLVQFPVSSLF